MLMERGDAVKEVLSNLRGYLGDHLPVDVDFLSKLQGKRLLAKENADQIRTAVETKGGKSGVDGLLHYMSSFYHEEMLEEFCVFLEEYSQPARPLLSIIAKKIREGLKQQQPPPTRPTVKDGDVPGPSGTATTPPAEEVSVQNTATTSQNGDIFYPVISDLEDDFSDLATEVLELIKSLKGNKLAKLCTYLANFLKPKVPPSSPPPHVPEEYDKLKPFLISRWDPLQIRVLQGVVRHLKSRELSKQLKAYEKVMGEKILAFMSECKIKKVPYKRLHHYSTVAVSVDCTPSEVSLSRILELKQFFISKLGLGEEHFEGFSGGSTVLYFSVPEDSVWCLPACLYPSNLPQLEEWKVVSLSVEGKFTIDLVEKRIVDILAKQSLSKHMYMIHVLMNENYKLKEKMADMEKSQRYYEEGDSGGRKVSGSVPIGKRDPISEEESSESEPLTKKPKLKLPNYPDITLKLETVDPNLECGSDVELFEEEKLKLSHLYWREEPAVPNEINMPTAIYLNGKIFVGERLWGYRQFLCMFDVVSRTWFKLPFHDSCEMKGFTLATSNSKVYTLGGTWRKDEKVEKYSNKVFSLDDDLKWCNTLPPLNIGRTWATSTSFDSFILVAGGKDRNGRLSSVEVLNSSQSSSTWWEICDLPVKSRLMQCTVTHDELFIGCGVGTEDIVYTAKLSAVKESLNIDEDSESSVSPESFWQSLPKTPLWESGLVSVNNCLLTVGGLDVPKPHSSVHLYDCYKKTWSKVSDIRKSRWHPVGIVSTFENKQELFVLGGGVVADISVESCELL